MKKWSQMSQREQKAAKAEYGSRSAYMAAKEKATAHKSTPAPTPAPTPKPTPKPTPAPAPTPTPSRSSSSSSSSSSKSSSPAPTPTPAPTQKWSDMSQQEQKAAKEEYGSRSKYQDAKSAVAPTPTPTPPPAPTQKWSQMTQQEQKTAKEEYGTRSAYQDAKKASTATEGPTKKWSDLTQKEQKDAKEEYGTREDYRSAKQLATQHIEGHDFTGGGKGSGVGKNIISKKDLNSMRNEGMSKQEILDKVNNSNAKIGGKGAQSLLDSYTQAIQETGKKKEETTASSGASTTSSAPVSATNNIVNETTQTVTSSGGTTNVQSNDIISTVTGNNNNTNINQDNSIRTDSAASSNSNSVISNSVADTTDAMNQAKAKELASNHLAGQANAAGETNPGVNNDSSALNVSQSGSNSSSVTNTQDNDITSTVTGDNNFTKITQDNSIRNYGGTQKNFNYVSTGNPGLDMPASMATLAGYYDVDDSPAKSAGFVDRYQTMNRDAQKKYENSGIAAEMIAKANAIGYDTTELDKMNRRRPEIARARYMQSQLNLFGDMYKYNAPDWNSPERQSGIERPNYDDDDD